MIKWSNKYLLGIDIIDEQHKELFCIAGDAYDLLKNEFYIDKYDKVVKLIEELKRYATFHFETEEKYMMEIGYKKLFSHKMVHNDFIKQVNEIDLEKVDENQEEYLASIIQFIVDWIEQHILRMDREYVSNSQFTMHNSQSKEK
ncbi:bacteriohemerythrin [Paratissierella segnis]|jgi:hemerythrin|uniref:Bacteriohemerythrin n=1 Tax=Paratissierella segnis TaxID=2763679 RepID=A0A926EU68_9FIRM|nr:hemerythrin family protein [Paratissierella segnis]MBC8588308.1 hemerythrin family protein [Paratissierella segnis]